MVSKFTLLVILPIVIILVSFVAFVLLVVPGIQAVGGDVTVFGAHRGNSLNFTENTIPAFEDAAKNEKYKFIEFDIMYTKDKQIVVHHDNSLLRLQKKPQLIERLDYEELENISNYHIPLYSEVMNITTGKKPLNIEIKSHGNKTDDEKIADYIIGDLKNRGILDSTLISSISSDVLKYISENYPDVETGKIYYIAPGTFVDSNEFIQEFYDELDKTGADYLMIHGTNLRNYDSLKKLKPDKKFLVVWYFTDEMYVLQPQEKSWIFNLKSSLDRLEGVKKGLQGELSTSQGGTGGKTKECIWWC
ncbi:MAG: glycerophosphodiester phosphodiesterase family protein [Candidatus Pacearchaeota archaeon]|jgi:glycerophosphoryl diester phosphodiesterase